MGGLGLGNLGLFLFLVLFQAWVVRVLVSLHTAAQVEAHHDYHNYSFRYWFE